MLELKKTGGGGGGQENPRKGWDIKQRAEWIKGDVYGYRVGKFWLLQYVWLHKRRESFGFASVLPLSLFKESFLC